MTTGLPSFNCCCGSTFLRITGRISAFGFIPLDIVSPKQGQTYVPVASIFLSKKIVATGTFSKWIFTQSISDIQKYFSITYTGQIDIDKFTQDISINESYTVTGDKPNIPDA